MNRFATSFAKAVTLTVLAAAAGLAAAAPPSNTQVLAVSASVSGICKFQSTSTPLAFGAIDPSSTTDATTTADVVYRCTKGTASGGITGVSGAHTMTGVTPANTLSYSLSIASDTGTGLGFGSGGDLTAVVTGTITAAQFQDVAADSYSEDVTLTITP